MRYVSRDQQSYSAPKKAFKSTLFKRNPRVCMFVVIIKENETNEAITAIHFVNSSMKHASSIILLCLDVIFYSLNLDA